MSIEYRVRLGAVSVAVCELAPLAVIVALAVGGEARRMHAERGPLILLLLSAVLALIGVYVADDQVHALSVYRDLLSPLLLFFLLATADLDRGRILSLARAFVLLATATAILGLVQYATDSYLWTLTDDGRVWLEFKTGLIRSFFLGRWLHTGHTLPIGLTAQTMNFAAYLVLPALVARALGWLPSVDPGSRTLWRACFWILLVALVLTFSRSSIFTLIVGWSLLRAMRTQGTSWVRAGAFAGVAALFVLLVILSGVVSFDALGTVRGRGTLIQAGLDLVRDHPDALLTGGYTDIYRTRYHGTQLPHNLVLYLVIQYGVPAALAWAGLVLVGVRRTFGALQATDPALRSIALAIFAGSAATVFMYAQTTSFIDTVQTGAWFFFWLALGVQIQRVPGFRAVPLAAPGRTAPAGPPDRLGLSPAPGA